MNQFTILSEDELKGCLSEMPDWSVEDGRLKASFTFGDFKQVIAFINMVAMQSEEMNHHPEWSNAYNKVNFAFSTHDAGNKITDLDIKMANKISEFKGYFNEEENS